MSAVQVTIIGVGPRGLSILQQISEQAHRLPAVDVHLVDPGESGQGVHSSRQPANLLTNTIANQVTMFPPEGGPSLTEWAAQTGYRRFRDRYHPTGDDAGEPLGEHDYLPRRMLGGYLSWVFDRTVRALPSRVRVVHHRSRAVDMEDVSGQRLAVRLEQGFEIHSDFVFLATGHCERLPTAEDRLSGMFVRSNAPRNPRLGYYSNPYPVDRLQGIEPGTDVAVQGFGLTAYDVVSALTAGRGGRFETTSAGLCYQPSGREPKLLLFSRQCLPFNARGVNQKGVTGQHRAAFFTREAVRRLRAVSNGQLDFEEQVLPLLLLEMGYAYRAAREQRHIPPEEYDFGPSDRRAVEAVLDPLAGRGFTSQAEFTKFFLDQVADDLAQARLGNLTSPVKAATDVIRDTRAALREAVEFGGLTPASHRVFAAKYVPLMNRVSFGPPRQRNAELRALFDAGVVDLAGGPGARVVTDHRTARFAVTTDFDGNRETRHADVLVIARLDLFHPEQDSSPLVSNLLARGLVRPFANGPFKAGGIDINRTGHPITAGGAPLPNAWAVGYVTEGPRFYTHALPRQGMPSQFVTDAETSVRDLVAQIRQRQNHRGDDRVHPHWQPASVS